MLYHRPWTFTEKATEQEFLSSVSTLTDSRNGLTIGVVTHTVCVLWHFQNVVFPDYAFYFEGHGVQELEDGRRSCLTLLLLNLALCVIISLLIILYLWQESASKWLGVCRGRRCQEKEVGAEGAGGECVHFLTIGIQRCAWAFVILKVRAFKIGQMSPLFLRQSHVFLQKRFICAKEPYISAMRLERVREEERQRRV